MTRPATYAALVADTAPPVPASFAVGYAHGALRTAIADLERGQPAWALSTLQTTLAMLDSAMVPELRAPRNVGDA